MKRRTVSVFLCVALVGMCLSARASCGGEGYRQSAPPLEIVKDYDLVEDLDPCAPFLTEGKGLREKSPFPSRLLLETREHQIAMTHRIAGCLRDCLSILHDAMRSGDYARLRELYRGLHGLRRQMERQTMPDAALRYRVHLSQT